MEQQKIYGWTSSQNRDHKKAEKKQETPPPVVLLSRSMSHKTRNTKTNIKMNKQTPRRGSSTGGLDFRLPTLSSLVLQESTADARTEDQPNQTSHSPKNSHVDTCQIVRSHMFAVPGPAAQIPRTLYQSTKYRKQNCILKDTRNITPLLICPT